VPHLPDAVTPEEVGSLRDIAARARWIDGRETARGAAARRKRNEQVDERSLDGTALAEQVLRALQRGPSFTAAAFPLRASQPPMNRYAPGTAYGAHVDNSPMAGAEPLRADLSGTLFLIDPADYDGGDLVVDSAVGRQAVVLPAGHPILHPATRVRFVAPVTRGVRLAVLFRVQSLVADAGRRALLFDLAQALSALEQRGDTSPEAIQLAACYHRLVQMWAQP
jgi:PKHD-type hydroxylase